MDSSRRRSSGEGVSRALSARRVVLISAVGILAAAALVTLAGARAGRRVGAHATASTAKATATASTMAPAPAPPPAKAQPAKRPNIVFVLTDDLAWNLVTKRYMPHVVALESSTRG